MNGNFVLIFDKRLEISNKYKKILEHNYCANVKITSARDDFFADITNLEPDLILISDSIEDNLVDVCKKIRILSYTFRPILIALSKSESCTPMMILSSDEP